MWSVYRSNQHASCIPVGQMQSGPSLAAEALRRVGGVLLDINGNRFCNELGRRDYVTGREAPEHLWLLLAFEWQGIGRDRVALQALQGSWYHEGVQEHGRVCQCVHIPDANSRPPSRPTPIFSWSRFRHFRRHPGSAAHTQQVSLADLIVLGGCVGVEIAAKSGGFTVEVPPFQPDVAMLPLRGQTHPPCSA